jgi:hypothetical protein
MSDLEKAVLDAAAKWAMADAISQDQPFGTGRNVWRKTAERLAIDVFVAARSRHHQSAKQDPPR